jgi:hypothetical protein
MTADPQRKPISESDRLEIATDEAIAACGGKARDAVRALIVANEFLEVGLRVDAGRIAGLCAQKCAQKIQNPCRLTPD